MLITMKFGGTSMGSADAMRGCHEKAAHTLIIDNVSWAALLDDLSQS
ncbi:MAG: hypothetical protein ACYDBJ_01580 [Aggregatilineales bacterium]